MRWSDAVAKPTDRKLREFAAAGATVCLGLAGWQWLSGNPWAAGTLAAIALAGACLGWRQPRWLAPLLTAAMIVTFPLAWGMSLVVLAVLYYGMFAPLGLLLRLLCVEGLVGI
jgi:hypothetical protein